MISDRARRASRQNLKEGPNEKEEEEESENGKKNSSASTSTNTNSDLKAKCYTVEYDNGEVEKNVLPENVIDKLV